MSPSAMRSVIAPPQRTVHCAGSAGGLRDAFKQIYDYRRVFSLGDVSLNYIYVHVRSS